MCVCLCVHSSLLVPVITFGYSCFRENCEVSQCVAGILVGHAIIVLCEYLVSFQLNFRSSSVVHTSPCVHTNMHTCAFVCAFLTHWLSLVTWLSWWDVISTVLNSTCSTLLSFLSGNWHCRIWVCDCQVPAWHIFDIVWLSVSHFVCKVVVAYIFTGWWQIALQNGTRREGLPLLCFTLSSLLYIYIYMHLSHGIQEVYRSEVEQMASVFTFANELNCLAKFCFLNFWPTSDSSACLWTCSVHEVCRSHWPQFGYHPQLFLVHASFFTCW